MVVYLFVCFFLGTVVLAVIKCKWKIVILETERIKKSNKQNKIRTNDNKNIHSMHNIVLQAEIYTAAMFPPINIYGHTALKIPVLVRSPKSSNVGRG